MLASAFFPIHPRFEVQGSERGMTTPMATGTGHRLDEIAHELFQLVTQICLSTLRGRRRGGELKEVEFLTLSLLSSGGTMIVGDIQKLLGILPAQMIIVPPEESSDKV